MADTRVRAGGRPREQGVSARVLDATVDLVASQGYARTTLDHVARGAGVAKTTIYRRWASKGELAVDALAAVLGEPPTGADSISADIAQAIRWLAARVRDVRVRGLLVGVVAEAGTDDSLRAALRARIRAPFAAELSARWGLPATEVDLAFDIVVGALLHRLAMNEAITERDAAAVAALATGLLEGARSDPGAGRPASGA